MWQADERPVLPTLPSRSTTLARPLGGIYYLDKDGHRRGEACMRWWDPKADMLSAAAHIPPGTQLFLADETPIDRLPDERFESPVEPYRHATPMPFGHYWWRKKSAEPARPTTMCLDFSMAKGGVLRACRWDPGMTLDQAEYVDI